MLKNCRPSASARSRRLQTPGRVSPRLGGARLGPGWGRAAHAGWPPRALARQPLACAILAWPDRIPASFWFTRSERRRLHASSRGAPLGTVRLRTATRTKACDPSQDTDAGQGLAPSACGAGALAAASGPATVRLYVPAQCAPAKTETLLPKMGGEERGLLLLPSRFLEGRSVGRAGRRAAPAPGVATGHGTLADGRGGGMHWNR